MDVTHFRNLAELRRWLKKHHAKATELWVGFYKKSSGQAGVDYKEAVDAALCFGWIDGVRRSIDDTSYTNRFSPRKSRSYWSQINLHRFQELEAAGLVEPAGRAAFERRDQGEAGRYSFESDSSELTPEAVRLLRRNRAAWKFFESQPPYYRRLAAHWIRSAKREETRTRRLATLIEDCAAGRRLKIVGGHVPQKPALAKVAPLTKAPAKKAATKKDPSTPQRRLPRKSKKQG